MMTVESASDRAAMLSDFGVDIVYTPSSGSFKKIKGIFDNEYEAVDTGATVEFAINRPHVLCRSVDVTDVNEGATIEINSTTYIVRIVMADGTGMTELILEKQ